MGKKGGGSAPKYPDPGEVAGEESRYNRLDVFTPGGSGIRYGYTDENGQFVASGEVPDGQRAAVSSVEGRSQQALREMLEPAAEIFTSMILGDNLRRMNNSIGGGAGGGGRQAARGAGGKIGVSGGGGRGVPAYAARARGKPKK